MNGRDELDNTYESFLDLMTTAGLAALSTAAALIHGDVFFGMLFASTTAFAVVHLIGRSVDV
jgi:hypothetical protein